MKKLYFLLIVLFIYFSSFGQKKSLDLSVPGNWPILTPQSISNDGKYVSYSLDAPNMKSSIIIRATGSEWKSEITGFVQGQFSEDSRRFVFRTLTDSLGILDLQKDSLYFKAQIISFSIPKEGNGQWLALLFRKPEKEFILYDLFTGEERNYHNVTDYQFNDSGNVLVMQVSGGIDTLDDNMLVWLNLLNKKSTIIEHGYQVKDLVFNTKGDELVFKKETKINEQDFHAIYYYKQGMDSAILLIGPSTTGMEGMTVNNWGNIFFSSNGNHIFFYIEKAKITNTQPVNSETGVHVRSYLDDDTGENEIVSGDGPFLAVVSRNAGNEVIQLQRKDDRVIWGNAQGYFSNIFGNDCVLLEKELLDLNGVDSNKTSSTYRDIYLTSLKDGSRVLIKRRLFVKNIGFSPTGKYIYWFDEEQNHWATYNIKLGLSREITAQIKTPLSTENDIPNRPSGGSFPLVGWMAMDSVLFIQDRYDTWQVDPEGIKRPVNITKDFGRRNHIPLRILDFTKDQNIAIQIGDTLLYSAFDEGTKMNGFFRVVLGRMENPEKLILVPKMFYHQSSIPAGPGIIRPFLPVKAKFATAYMLECMSPKEYPNLYISTNLIQFRQLTHLEPEKEFNWYTTELHHWKLPNGKKGTGILYKPENFDPNKKYPVIFYYYEKNSDALNYFIHPTLSNGAINIPFFVSNNYLVFFPDIYYKTGYPGQSAYNSIVSAALELSRLPYVDSRHMAIQGHSFGGFETNYIVSRSHLFAAAAPSAGVSDLICGYTSTRNERYYESGQGRIGVSLWQGTDLYLENSSIFRANKITTPILIMHNRQDPIVPFSQSQEWYDGLVRSGKKVWMLSYDGEGHTLQVQANKLDYSIRLKQFFDHYLQGATAPKWMNSGMDPGVK